MWGGGLLFKKMYAPLVQTVKALWIVPKSYLMKILDIELIS